MHPISRRKVLGTAMIASVASIAPLSARTAADKTVLIEQTFLKAAPGKRENLIRYLS
jgi:hypothetical protein